MTDSKILNRLIDFAPVIIHQHAAVRARCIAATAVGLDVLHVFGIMADPFPVLVELHNAAFVAARRRGADVVTAVARGGHILVTSPESTADGWPGHLMIHVPRHQTLIDLDFQQFRRPHEHIKADAAEVLHWPTGTTSRTFQDPTGAQLIVEATTDHTYRAARDWYDVDRRAPIVTAVVRAILKNRI